MAYLFVDITLRNHSDEWAELVANTSQGKRFLSLNHQHISRVPFYDPDDALPVIPWAERVAFVFFAASEGIIVV